MSANGDDIFLVSLCPATNPENGRQKTNYHRKRMDNNTGNGIISLLYTSSYSYPGFFTSMQRFLYSVFVRPRIFFYRIHMTAAKKKKHYSERKRNFSADTAYDYPPNPLRRTVLCTRLASLISEVSLDRSFANPTQTYHTCTEYRALSSEHTIVSIASIYESWILFTRTSR